MTPQNENPRDILLRQLGALYGLSVRRLFFSKFMVTNVALGAIPVAVTVLILVSGNAAFATGEYHKTFDQFVRALYLHFIIFFVGNIFGFAIIRQELDDQTLHFLLLQPIRRWSLIVAKLLAYLTLASAVCVGGLWLSYAIIPLWRIGPSGLVADLFVDGRFLVLVRQSVVLVLGLLAYGCVAMAIGSFVKSSFYALLLLGWESGLSYLPPALKMWTVVHYLHSLLPEPIQAPRQIFEMIGEPASILVSLAVLTAVSAVGFATALIVFQLRQCLYGET
jgi:ABC-type Na+ efflux pump permease subunit